MEFLRELQIAFIVRRHAAYRAGSIANQHVISNPDRNLAVSRWINRACAGEHTGFFF